MNHERLMATLTDPDAETRRDAFEDLAEEMDDDLARAILDVATGELSDEIRADALVALGPVVEECSDEDDLGAGSEWDPEMGPPVLRQTFQTIVQRIRAIYDDEGQPKLLRRRAFEVLVRHPQPWQRAEIRRHLASPDDEWRLTAIFGMGAMSGFEKELLDLVTNGQGIHLAEAVRAAGLSELTAAAGKISRLAESPDTERDLRLEAIYALPHVDRDSFEVLEELSESDDPEIAEAAAEALEELSAGPEDEW